MLLTLQAFSGLLRASTPLLRGEICRNGCRGFIDVANQQGLLPSRAQAMKLPSRSRDAGIGRPLMEMPLGLRWQWICTLEDKARAIGRMGGLEGGESHG